jgi:NADPH2:quinone reductase
MIVQMARALGARVLGTTSTQAKAEVARKAGAHEVILYTETAFDAEVKRLTDGRGVDVVYDSVGQATFDKSLNSLRPRGLLALFGQSSGSVPPFDPSILNGKGSLFLTRPSLAHHILTREELVWRAGDVFKGLQSGALTLNLHRTFTLDRAADAHRLLEGRTTTGKIVLTVAA